MEEKLVVSIVQTKLTWENKIENLKHLEGHLSKVEQADIIVLPEMFSTGFSMNTAVAETMDGDVVAWMKEQAMKKNSAIVGSLMMKDDNTFYNRLLFVKPGGELYTYDKRHLFTLADEPIHYSKGTSKVIVEYKGWRILPLVCYDLRFPIWSRNTIKNSQPEYDLLLYVANWPKKRRYAWSTLLKARAIENVSYVVGVNRVGVDSNGFEYSGNSVVLDYLGEELVSLPENEEGIRTAIINRGELEDFRKAFPALNDADDFIIQA
jgi:predicted amidohydrolase